MKGILFLYNDVSFFNEILDAKMDFNIDLMSGFLSAIDSFAREISHGTGIETLELGGSRLIFLRVPLKGEKTTTPEMLKIVTIAAKDEDSKKVGTLLEQIKNAFFEVYSPQDVISWDGNMLRFTPFKRVLHKILEQGSQQRDETLVRELTDLKGEGGIFSEGFSFIMISEDASDLKHVLFGASEEHAKALLDKLRSDFLLISKQRSGNLNDLTWDVLVPLVQQNKFVYVVAKPLINLQVQNIPPPTGVIFALYCYFIDGQNQIYFPKVIPAFKEKIRTVQEKLNTETFADYNKIFELVETNFKGLSLFKTVAADSQDVVKNLSKLLEGKYKNFDQLVHALITGRSVAILGNPEEAKELANALLVFCPHRSLRIQNDPAKPVGKDDVDIVTVDPKAAKDYEDFVQVDLKKGVIKNGKSSRYCENLVKKLHSMQDPSLAYMLIKRQTNWLLSKASMIRNLTWGEKIDPKALQEIRGDLDKDSEEIVIELAAGRSTFLQNIVDQMCLQMPSQQLMLDSNFVKFSDKKILVSSNLTNEQAREYLLKLTKIGGMFLGPRFMETIIKGS